MLRSLHRCCGVGSDNVSVLLTGAVTSAVIMGLCGGTAFAVTAAECVLRLRLQNAFLRLRLQ